MLGTPFAKIPGWVSDVFTPEDYGARGNDPTHNDTQGVQDAFRAAIDAGGGKVQFRPTTVYRLTDELLVDGPCSIIGGGSFPRYGPRSNYASDTMPTVAPYLRGSVLLQTEGGANGIRITAVGESVNLAGFGIRFDDPIRWSDTGHGVFCDPPSYSTYQDNGVIEGNWDGVHVFGHDGNHYAFNLVNAELLLMNNLRGWGGGGMRVHTNSAISWFGNCSVIEPYFCTLCAGTAHGFSLSGAVAGHGTILMCYHRPQSFFLRTLAAQKISDPASMAWIAAQDIPTAPSVPGSPASPQGNFYIDDNTEFLRVIAGDFEGLSSNGVRLPGDMPGSTFENNNTSDGDRTTYRFGNLSFVSGAPYVGNVPLFPPSGGQVVATGDLNPMTTSYVLVPGLTTGSNLEAGTYDVTASLRWFNTGGTYAEAVITDSSGNVLSPEEILYSSTSANQQSTTTLEARITLSAPKTLQARAKSNTGGGILLGSDSAGSSWMKWTRVLT